MNQTELDAVNALLIAINDSPVNSLDIVHTDIESALAMVRSSNQDLQSEGWYFNTESFNFALDVDGKQVLPDNTLFVNTVNPNWIKRGSYLYDLKNHSYDFSEQDTTSKVELVLLLTLEELPYIVFSLVVARAKIQYISELESDATKIQVVTKQAQNMYIQLQRMHLKFHEPNALQSPQARRLLMGTSYYNTGRL